MFGRGARECGSRRRWLIALLGTFPHDRLYRTVQYSTQYSERRLKLVFWNAVLVLYI